MSGNELQNLEEIISQVVLRLLQERGVRVNGSSTRQQDGLAPNSLMRQPGSVKIGNAVQLGRGTAIEGVEVAGRILVAVCCEECLNDQARTALDALHAAHFEITQPAEDELKQRVPRERLIAEHDVVLLPAVGDDDAAKMALGIFDEPVARTALSAIALGKPLIAALHAPYDEALKTRSPLLKRMFEGHRRALASYGFEIVPATQLVPIITARFGTQSNALNGGGAVKPAGNGKKQLITAQDIDQLARKGQPLQLPAGALITPLARDRARELGLDIQ
ncbi:MAG: hypothetical protein JO316_11860 [Abitibacteriaceae bacterium]|nr:hypothetical protein [Abditibacteriaceae bacterium]MBV9866040.1 hypothetical protein [Abditibacteriaceae bacterium]